MTKLQSHFQEYSKTHTHPTNLLIHFYCVPIILWTVMAMLYVVPLMSNWGLNACHLFLAFLVVKYFTWSTFYGALMIPVGGLFILSFELILLSGISLLYLALTLFVICWILQFYGHKVEGKKPSFVTDIKFLIVGPLWVVEKLRIKKL